ncbi:unnamed protein product, partial [Nesidiocoris tenuis]
MRTGRRRAPASVGAILSRPRRPRASSSQSTENRPSTSTSRIWVDTAQTAVYN